MNKAVIGVLVVFVLACLGYVLFGMSGGPAKTEDGTAAEASAKSGGGEGTATKAAPVVKRDDDKADEPTEDGEKKDLALPGQLPKLNLPEQSELAQPTKPHGELQIEGELEQATAEQAIRAVFPKIRGCYAELRARAPQAKGRMLMRIRVSSGEAKQAGTGELYLKETQFTDPKYLTCVRSAIDETKFKIDKDGINGTVEFPMYLMPEDVEKHEKAMGAAAEK